MKCTNTSDRAEVAAGIILVIGVSLAVTNTGEANATSLAQTAQASPFTTALSFEQLAPSAESRGSGTVTVITEDRLAVYVPVLDVVIFLCRDQDEWYVCGVDRSANGGDGLAPGGDTPPQPKTEIVVITPDRVAIIRGDSVKFMCFKDGSWISCGQA